ncbi:heme-copper oxidase subunit III [Luteolibacter ambystomatis]|uniref:Heme-copper oxidase subunit III n=1 Tax=Luteolibacter ambystomatis TaxID=2824561 RepID=A0A975IYG5_9BACT|nr:cytochrome c oxidase subunit 3 [Luteolibacter ambystomatis]QUE49858.1 heme-copper oxidase subunit III [Luteolibacter ambystomatis]
MEIPYVVTPRKDTGLINSKIAIWLFLASEVMLFGGFFSAYVFLRIGADYPWPERALPVIPGLVNTFVLIASSVTVVFAWASLKLRQWGRFQAYMGFTILCACVFMVLKGIEYNVKFHHQALRMTDGAVVEGHLGSELKEGVDPHGKIKEEDYALDHHGNKIEEDRIFVDATSLTFSSLRYHKDWVEEILKEASSKNAKVTLASEVKLDIEKNGKIEKGGKVFAAGTPLTVEILAEAAELHKEARAHNGKVRTQVLRDAWDEAHTQYPHKADWEISDKVAIDPVKLEGKLATEVPSLAFKVEPAVKLEFKPRDVKEGPTQSRLRDDTVVEGKLLESPMKFHYVDAIDFRYLALKAKEKGIDPAVAVEKSWILANSHEIKDAWEWHKGQIAELQKYLTEKYGLDKNGNPKREPTFTERYRIEWKDFAAKAEGKPRTERESMPSFAEQIKGPDYEAREEKHTFPHLEVPREQVAFSSKFAPAWSTYYAIYFTMTGLHGLHVIGGALVLAYYLFFGKKMYLSNPEWLANRVEVGGLFWHFVDLVWIFLFPLLYLM